MLRKTEAIVLRNTPFADADLIVTYLTLKFGIIKAYAKSPKKIKSRFGSSLEPLTYSNIAFFGKEQTALPRLTQSDIIKPFQSLREDFKSMMQIYEMIELCTTFLPEKEPNDKIFKLLLNTLLKIESNGSHKICRLYFKLKFLEITGLLPSLDVCARCGRASDGKKYHAFYISDGSIICSSCSKNEKEPFILSESALKFYKSLLKWNPAMIDRIKAPESLLSELLILINAHIHYAIGSKLRMLKVPLTPTTV